MTQIARNLTDAVDGFLRGCSYLIHDRDPLFTRQFRSLVRVSGVEAVRLPARSPNLNAYAERSGVSVHAHAAAAGRRLSLTTRSSEFEIRKQQGASTLVEASRRPGDAKEQGHFGAAAAENRRVATIGLHARYRSASTLPTPQRLASDESGQSGLKGSGSPPT